MRRAGFLIIGLAGVAALLAADAAEARPRFGPRTLFRALGAPLGVVGGMGRMRARHAYRHPTARRTAAQTRHRRALAAASVGGVSAGSLGAAALAAPSNWAGPVFWPTAYEDMIGYAVRAPGFDMRVWSDGFADVLAGILSQSGADERSPARGRARSVSTAGAEDRTPGIAQDAAPKSCGSATPAIVDDMVAQIEQTVRPKPAQQAAFKDLKSAMTRAADDLKTACPGATPLTPLARLNAMQQRLWAMQSAARAVRAPLANLAALLDDEQKARLNGMPAPPPTRQATRRDRSAGAATSPVQICYMQSRGASEWPVAEIRERLRPTQAQEAGLKTLTDTAGGMAKFLISSCPKDPPAGALERIDAVLGRLDAMLYAISVVDAPLQGFYGSLSDEQKARFNALGGPAAS